MSKFDIPFPDLPRTDEGKRICQVIKLRPEALSAYKERGERSVGKPDKQCHAAVWPGVLAVLRQAHIVDYSIHYFEPHSLLIAHMRYIGTDYEADMAIIAADPETHKWWTMTDGMQESFIPGAVGSATGPGWWTPAEEVFRMEG